MLALILLSVLALIALWVYYYRPTIEFALGQQGFACPPITAMKTLRQEAPGQEISPEAYWTFPDFQHLSAIETLP